ncbi:hypothetical protein ACSBR1_012952 [Camellia fascicularis]
MIRTQILYVADISFVIMYLELVPGCLVLESGTESGSLTTLLARVVAPTGHVYTFDFHEQRVASAREDFERTGLSGVVTVGVRDIQDIKTFEVLLCMYEVREGKTESFKTDDSAVLGSLPCKRRHGSNEGSNASSFTIMNGEQRSSEDVPKTIEVFKPTKTLKIKEISGYAQLQSVLLPILSKWLRCTLVSTTFYIGILDTWTLLRRWRILKPTYTNSSNTILALTSNAIHLIWRWPYEAKATMKNPTQLWHPISGTLIAQDLTNVRIEEAKPISLCPKMILTSFQHQVKSKLEDHSKLITGLGFPSLYNLLVSIGADDQCNKWISKKSCFLQLLAKRSSRKLSETEVQFHQNRKHFLAMHELKLAVYETIKLECVMQWSIPKMSTLISHATFSCNS